MQSKTPKKTRLLEATTASSGNLIPKNYQDYQERQKFFLSRDKEDGQKGGSKQENSKITNNTGATPSFIDMFKTQSTRYSVDSQTLFQILPLPIKIGESNLTAH